MSRPWHATLGLLALAFASTVAAQSATSAAQSAEARIVEETNAFRTAQGRSNVAVDRELADAARDFARFLAASGKFGHEADGRDPSARAIAHGYEPCIVAENLAYEYDSRGAIAAATLAQHVVEGWKHSTEHRRNMLLREVTQTGVGVARGASGRYYAVQLFGRPRSLSIEFSVENRTPDTVRYTVNGRSYSLAPRVRQTHRQCADAQLTLQSHGSEAGAEVRPGNGDRYVVVSGRRDEIRLQRE